jgi:hypothetical protein
MASLPNTGTTMVTIFSGNPNGIIQGNQGDVVSDPVTPALWQATGAGYSTIWTQGSGGQGTQGPQGAQGSPGSQGANGAQGAQGATGSQGPTGPQGPTGSNGAQGAQGAQGPGGSTGPQGATGAAGPQGGTGPQGAQGPQGLMAPPQTVSFSGLTSISVLTAVEVAAPSVGSPVITLHSTGQGSGSTITSGSFTPVAYEVLLLNFNQVGSASTTTVTDSFGLTWHESSGMPQESGSDISDSWYALVPNGYSGGAITITVTSHGGTGNSVLQVTGVTSSSSGVIQTKASYASGSTISETLTSPPLNSSTVVGLLVTNQVIEANIVSTQGMYSLTDQLDAGTANLIQTYWTVAGAGPPGPQGAQGTQGSQGAQGSQGSQGTQGTGNALLALLEYAPGTQALYSTTSTTPVAVDSTNLTISFVAPPSGNVLVRLSGAVDSTDAMSYFCLLTHGTTTQISKTGIAAASNANADSRSVPFSITGLTPGNTYQYDWGYFCDAGSTIYLCVQGTSSGRPGTYNRSIATMEVWAQGAIAGTQGAQGPPGWPATVASVAVSSNAATVAVTAQSTLITNNAAGSAAITMATSGAVDGQSSLVRFLDHSNVSQTLSWVNTENSNVIVPTASNGSTTLPITVGFIYNGATSKWRCVAVV